MATVKADILESLEPREARADVLVRLQRMAFQAIDHPVWREFRAAASRDHEFWEGRQWTAAEIRDLNDRDQPVTTINEIKPVISRKLGEVLELYQTVAFVGRNAPDEAESNALSDILRWIDQTNNQEFEESRAVLDALISGFAVEEITTKEDEDGQPMVVERYVDALNYIYPDPYSTHYDWNKDARFIIRAAWMDLEDAVAEWPDKRVELEAVVNGDTIFDFAGQSSSVQNNFFAQFVDRDRRRIRPAEVWYKRRARRFDILDSSGAIIPIGIPLDRRDATTLISRIKSENLQLRERIVNEMWVGVFAVNTLIHHDRSPYAHNMYPFVPLWCWRKKDGGPYGEVRNAISPQEAINKRESKALNMLSARRIIFETGAIDDIAEASRQNARADGIVEVNEGALSGKRIIFPDNVDIGQAQLALHQNAVQALHRIMSSTERDRGLSPEIRSGVGVARQQRSTQLTLNPLIQNLRQFRRIKAEIKLALIKQFFTSDLVFQVTDDPNAPRIVNVPASRLDAIRTKKFDVVIVDSVDHSTTRAEELEKIFTLLPQLAPLGPAWVKVAVSLSNIREKEGLMKLIDATSEPPPPAPKMSLSFDYNSLDPEERAAFWLMMKNEPLARHLLQNRPDSALLKQLKADIAKTQIKEGTKAMFERGRVDERAQQIALEGLKSAKELSQKDVELALEAERIQNERQQMEIDARQSSEEGEEA